MEQTIETINDQLVSVLGNQIIIALPKHRMTKEEALRLAAWLVAMADDDDNFHNVLRAVQNT